MVRHARSVGTVSLAALCALLVLAATADARWRSLSDTSFDDQQVCRDGMTFEFATGTVPPANEDPLAVPFEFGSPPPDPPTVNGENVRFPSDTVVGQGTLSVPHHPRNDIPDEFNPGSFVSREYDGVFTVLFNRTLPTGVSIMVDFAPGDFIIRPTVTAEDCILAPPQLPPVVDPVPPPDKTAPVLSLGGKSTQKVLKQKGVLIDVACPTEACTVNVTGSVSVPNASRLLKFKTKSVKLPQAGKATLKLKLSTRSFRKVRRALRSRSRLRSSFTVKVQDAAGNTTSQKRTVKLKR